MRAGETILLPTDTVYGLACAPQEEAVRRLYAVKGRGSEQPTALVAACLDRLVESLPELRGRSRAILDALLPGPYTLVLANPSRRYPWLTGTRPDAIGVRVPVLDGPGAEVLEQVGTLAATSANLPGGPDPRVLADVPAALRAGVAAAVDGGELSGIPSTVLDCTGLEPIVLRAGAVPAADALERVRVALASGERQ